MKPSALFRLMLLMVATCLLGCDHGSDNGPSSTKPTEKDAVAEKSSEYTREHAAEMVITALDGDSGELTLSLTPATVGAKKGFDNDTEASVTPVFLLSQAGSDVYRIECKYPLGSEMASKTAKEITFDGVETAAVKFPNENLSVTIRPVQNGK